MTNHRNLLASNTSGIARVVDLRADPEDTPVFDSTPFGAQSLIELQAEETEDFYQISGVSIDEIKNEREALSHVH